MSNDENILHRQVNASVVDLFCGCGGLSYGFRKEGFHVSRGYDIDDSCRYPFEENNDAPLRHLDIAALTSDELKQAFRKDAPRVLVGCAPCQPFSKYSQRSKSSHWQLIQEFSRLVTETKPHVLSMENVPPLVTFQGGSVFKRFVRNLKRAQYEVNWDILYGPNFGLPQTRSRLVLIASRLGFAPALPNVSVSKDQYLNVRDAIGDLPPLQAGESNRSDPMHKCCRLSPLNVKRIRASQPGGSWKDWDPELLANCHRASSGASFRSVYGRMRWDQPGPTITTQFYGYGRGRFGHPTQDRALSLREGADLQSFPRSYRFVKDDEQPHITVVGRQIGNAVPIVMAQAIASAIATHLSQAW